MIPILANVYCKNKYNIQGNRDNSEKAINCSSLLDFDKACELFINQHCKKVRFSIKKKSLQLLFQSILHIFWKSVLI